MQNRIAVNRYGVGTRLALMVLMLAFVAGCGGAPANQPEAPEATIITAETPTPSVTPTESVPAATATPTAAGYPAPPTPADPYPAMTLAAAEALTLEAYPYP